ncbi:APC family permease [Clostridium magnum]|uniref:Serine/threonine exchanger SteT n=1 Tax=Clostridium magnum DSM 2767 TaxID=1121326 RepID=A0A162QTZ6_9CLOT|nr:APC family permease [Clostridium magnum]KZL88964.1 serine/threonine exchanger SteT [Clostridium magnum DSM 2767]SHJ45191.1 amino acid/polyamine/organocation transporter, APC superfamily (TC 2.A.3) [Clostridium magnum DSM 2767]
MGDKKKLGFWSIILLGINGVIGTGIFLLPGKAMKLMGPGSIWVYFFDMLLVMAMTLCFAEVAGIFNKNGGPYVYAKEAFGEFIGFEVGIMKLVIGMIAWATFAVGFTTALTSIWPAASNTLVKNSIQIGIIVGLSIINMLGVNFAKHLNNIMTIGKLVPLILFVAVGIFFIKGGNFTPMFPTKVTTSSFGATAILIFFAFTGFESIAVAAEDMENPKKNLPLAILLTMLLVSVIYILVQAVSIGTLGVKLASSTTPVADSASIFLGGFGGLLVTIGTLVSIGGINAAESFILPRSAVALAEDGLLPRSIAKKNKAGTPYIAIVLVAVLTIPIALSGSFTQLAAISAISRFAQYIPTCLAVIVLRKRPGLESTFRVPFGPVLPILSVGISCWLLTQATKVQIIWGLGALIIGIPLYFIMKKGSKSVENNETC